MRRREFTIVFFTTVGALDRRLAGLPAVALAKEGGMEAEGDNVVGSADQSVDDEGEHGAEGMADGFGMAGVGELRQSIAQCLELIAFECAAGSGGVTFANCRVRRST